MLFDLEFWVKTIINAVIYTAIYYLGYRSAKKDFGEV